MSYTPGPLPEPALEDHEYELWGQNARGDFFTAEQLSAHTAAEVARAVAAEREQMIADGWRKTRYEAPVTECEACMTEDACRLRGQCGHYLRERQDVRATPQPLQDKGE